MPMDLLDPYPQLVMKAPPSPDYIPGPEAPPSPDYIPGPEYPDYRPPADDVLLDEEQPLPSTVSPTVESPGYITDLEPEMDPEEEDGDDEKSEGDFIDYPTSRGDDDGDKLSVDDADDEDEEESSDSKEEKEEHLALIEGETAATPPPSAYRLAARISVRPHIPMPFYSESESIYGSDEICRTIYIYSSTTIKDTTDRDTTVVTYTTTYFIISITFVTTSGSESIPEADMLLQKRTRFTTPSGGYEVGESSVVAAARQIRPALP
uniref:Uncharacterized protein n=1 Tax=Tanacetum cinerariifolium TaxID=118510 RepID=A0A699KT42_TANCI|nr:hypothetical protein [Tanacetum cinerariifolium]